VGHATTWLLHPTHVIVQQCGRSMECLDANAVQDLMSGAPDETMRANTVKHLDGCETAAAHQLARA
jgi:hypothetical protein